MKIEVVDFSNAQNFLVSHFNYVQNVDLLLLTIDRYAAIASIAKNRFVRFLFRFFLICLLTR